MITINENFLKLSDNYLFSEIARRVNTFKRNNPDKQVISLGIGDVTQPLPKASVQAMVKAVEEMGRADTFRGYGPEHGYEFLIRAIIANDYLPRGIELFGLRGVYQRWCQKRLRKHWRHFQRRK